jgi:hypothetical protein
VLFLFADTSYQSKLAGFAKIFNILKDQLFDEVFSVLVLLPEVPGIFQKKKNTHPDWVLLPTVKISAQTDEICGFAGEKTLGHFWTLGSPEVYEDEVWQLWVYGNFFSTHRDLSTLKVSKILARPFLRNVGRGGGPLKLEFSGSRSPLPLPLQNLATGVKGRWIRVKVDAHSEPFKWLKIAEKGWEWLGISVKGWGQLQMPRNGRKCSRIFRNGCEWLPMPANTLKCSNELLPLC